MRLTWPVQPCRIGPIFKQAPLRGCTEAQHAVECVANVTAWPLGDHVAVVGVPLFHPRRGTCLKIEAHGVSAECGGLFSKVVIAARAGADSVAGVVGATDDPTTLPPMPPMHCDVVHCRPISSRLRHRTAQGRPGRRACLPCLRERQRRRRTAARVYAATTTSIRPVGRLRRVYEIALHLGDGSAVEAGRVQRGAGPAAPWLSDDCYDLTCRPPALHHAIDGGVTSQARRRPPCQLRAGQRLPACLRCVRNRMSQVPDVSRRLLAYLRLLRHQRCIPQDVC